MKFSCIIPTYDNGPTIRAAIESVLAQTVQDFELLIVCDGAPPDTHAIADEFAAGDARIRVLKFEKGERRGELWRHQALMESSGDAVCYLSDDDCWFPDHLEVMAQLLANADFAHTAHTSLSPAFDIRVILVGITDPAAREQMREGSFNIMGPTVVGHRLDAYKRLPQGWSPSPLGTPSDLNMWRKWIAADGVRFAAHGLVTSLHAPRGQRDALTVERRANEADYWRYAFRDDAMREALRRLSVERPGATIRMADVALLADALRAKTQVQPRHGLYLDAKAELDRIYASRTWRYTQPFRQIWRGIRNAVGLGR